MIEIAPNLKTGMGSHQSARMKNDEWLTPPEIIKSLGKFDLDPCAPEERPWDTADIHFTKTMNGLLLPWGGRVFMNPPYGLEAALWLDRLSRHGNGIALTFARTETKMFFDYVWNKANAMLFIKGRLFFYSVNGIKASANAGAPSVLIAYGQNNVDALADCKIPGKFILL